MKKFRFLSSLTLASVIISGATYAATGTTEMYGEYKAGELHNVENSSAVAFKLTDAEDKVTVEEIIEKGGYTNVKVNGNDAEGTTEVSTGDFITTDESTEQKKVVVYSDVNGDKKVDIKDVVYASELSADIEHEGQKEENVEAADVENNGTIDIKDVVRISEFSAGITGVEAAVNVPEAKNQLELELKAKEVTPDGTSVLQDVVIDNETSEITLNVIPEKLNETFDFTLTNVPANTTLTSESGITGADVTAEGELKVTVPAEVGDYDFTLKNDEKVKKVTVHVVDATMPTNYAFRSWRDEDISRISDEDIKANSTEVKAKSELFADNQEEINGDIKFKGNVNTMNETENGEIFYRVRIKVEGIKPADVIAVNKETKKEYETMPVEDNESEVYVLLDAIETNIDLVLANKNASEKQIENGVSHKVTFESASKIWLRYARASENANRQNYNHVKNIEITNNNSHILDVGIAFDGLSGVKLETENGTIKDTPETNGNKWIPILVRLGNKENSGSDLRNTVYIDENSNAKIDNTLPTTSNPYDILLWVKSNGQDKQQIPLTLNYRRGGDKDETLPVTVVLHDASAPKITKVEPGDDENAKALQNLSVTPTETAGNNRVRADKITVDTHKYGMNVVKHTDYTGKEIEGRWYSLKLTFNVPVESILFNNSGNEAAQVNQRNWQPFTEANGNEITIWIDRDAMEKGEDKTTNTVEQTLCNKWAIGKDSNGYTQDKAGTAAEWTVGVTIEENEKTYVGLHDKYPIGTSSVNNAYNYSDKTLQGITVVETIKDNLINESLNSTLNVMSGLNYDNNHKLSYNSETNTATIKLPINKISEITVNNQKGRWMVAYLNVTSKTIEDENGGFENGIFVDKNNISNLVSSEKYDTTHYRVPVWIDLKNETVKKAIKTETNTNPTPIEIKFSNSSPVKETNSVKVVFEDESTAPALDLSETTSPKTPSLPKLDSLKEEEKKVEYEKWLGNADTTETPIQQADLTKLTNNESKVKNISYETYGNTVYVKITADLANLDEISNKGKIIPLELDISALSNETGDVYIHLSKYDDNTWGKCSENQDYKGNTFYLGATYDSTKNNGCEDVYITKSGDTVSNGTTPAQLTTPYIHYVIEFVQQ